MEKHHFLLGKLTTNRWPCSIANCQITRGYHLLISQYYPILISIKAYQTTNAYSCSTCHFGLFLEPSQLWPLLRWRSTWWPITMVGRTGWYSNPLVFRLFKVSHGLYRHMAEKSLEYKFDAGSLPKINTCSDSASLDLDVACHEPPIDSLILFSWLFWV